MLQTTKNNKNSIPPIYGHDAIIKNINKAIHQQTLHPALLFSGPSGVGKKQVALYMAQSLLCKDSNFPCGVCDSCKFVSLNTHPDILLLEADGLMIKVQNLAKIRDFVSLQSFSKKRIVIIDEAQKMNIQTQNGLLKLLEEPPVGVYFILVCDEIQKLLTTIRSRVQNTRFNKLKDEDLKKIFPDEDDHLLKMCRGQVDRIDQWRSLSDFRSEIYGFWECFLNKKLITLNFISLVRKRDKALLVARIFQEILRDTRFIKEGKEDVIHFDQKSFLKKLSILPARVIDILFKKSIQLELDISSGLDVVLCFENFYHQAIKLCEHLSVREESKGEPKPKGEPKSKGEPN